MDFIKKQLATTVLAEWWNIFLQWLHQHPRNKYIAGAGLCASYFALHQFWWFVYRKYHHLPPGPNGLPFIGLFYENIFPWTKPSRKSMVHTYGPIIYIHTLGIPVVILSCTKYVKQLFPQKEFLDRDTLFDANKDWYHSIFSSGRSCALPFSSINGEAWRKRRKLAQDTLFKVLTNDLVMQTAQETIENEVEPYLLNEIIGKNKVWFTAELCEYITFNTIFRTLFGYSLARDSKLYAEMVHDVEQMFKLSIFDFLVVKVPFMKYIFGRKLDEVRHRRDSTLTRLIKERAQQKHAAKSYVDYTHQLVVDGDITQDEEIADAVLMFSAGTETTASTLNFGIAILAKHIDIQNQLRNELQSVYGKNGQFDLKRVNDCPLFRAGIHEIIRIASVAFLGLNHICHQDYWITMEDGTRYRIPKNTPILAQMEYFHCNNEYGNEQWKGLHADKPYLDNFLVHDDDGGVRFVKNESFIPFGVGRRDCVGRQLAVKELQFVLAYLLLNYQLALEKPIENILDRKKHGLITAFLSPPVGIRLTRLS